MPDRELRLLLDDEDTVIVAAKGNKLIASFNEPEHTRLRIKTAPAGTPPPDPVPPPVVVDHPPLTDPAGFRRLFVDDFDVTCAAGEFLTKYPRWSAYPSTWQDTSKHGWYGGEKWATVSNSILTLPIATENNIHRVVNLSPLILPGEKNQLYGRYEIRMRADPMDGYKAAYLLWPKSEQWPRDGEIDFPEGDFDRRVSAFMHRQGASSGSDQDAFNTATTYGGWHTYVTEWTPNRCEFFIDGVSIGKATSRIPNTPMRWQIQNETALDGTVPANDVKGVVQIAYVAVWAYAP